MARLAHSIVLLTTGYFGVPVAAAQSPARSLENPAVLLAEVQGTNGFWGDTLKPWHLKANYEIYDANKVSS